jgi:hypothetical protein
MTRPIELLRQRHYENSKSIMHEIDKAKNPDRHNITKDYYNTVEISELCISCAEEIKNNYVYDARTNAYYRKKP